MYGQSWLNSVNKIQMMIFYIFKHQRTDTPKTECNPANNILLKKSIITFYCYHFCFERIYFFFHNLSAVKSSSRPFCCNNYPSKKSVTKLRIPFSSCYQHTGKEAFYGKCRAQYVQCSIT